MSAITRDAYLGAFATWFQACEAAEDPDLARVAKLERPAWAQAVATAGPILPDEAEPAVFCTVLRPLLPRVLVMRILKSCLLDRLIYVREQLRTVPCPEHQGRWAGIEGPSDWGPPSCPHGCGMTGWLPNQASE